MRCSLLSLLALPLLLQTACAPPAYQTYVNQRYGYQIDYPPELVPQGVAQNGDGQVFLARDAELRVYASACVEGWDQTPAEYLKRSEKTPGISYRTKGKNFAVVSGMEGTRIFYQKVLINGSMCTHFKIEYEREQRQKYDPAVEKIAASFRAGE